MDSTVMPKSIEADDALAARADDRLAHAYEQIARADEQLARLTEQLTKMEQVAAMEQDMPRHPSVLPLRRPSRGRPALRGFVGLLAAACIIGGALAWQSPYGEAARPAIARWAAPYIGSVSWLAPAQSAPSGVRLAAAEAAPPPATLAAVAGSQESASPAVALDSPEMSLLQAMARDLAAVQQGIQELKAYQERLASDNARAVEQFKASQEQMTRVVARLSEQEQRARVPAPPPQPAAANPARKPAPAQVSSQARAQPLQLQPR